jgi:hypothetical protein
MTTKKALTIEYLGEVSEGLERLKLSLTDRKAPADTIHAVTTAAKSLDRLIELAVKEDQSLEDETLVRVSQAVYSLLEFVTEKFVDDREKTEDEEDILSGLLFRIGGFLAGPVLFY